MKVAEIRQRLKAFPQDTMIELFVAAYKHVPKDRKEAIIDDLILHGFPNPQEKAAAKKKAKTAPQVDFPALSAEIKRFLENAYAQNYFAPNRVIPKAQRPKWRFLVMRYIKELNSIQAADPHFNEANELLAKLFEMIAYACNYYLFSTEDAFASIRMPQEVFYEIVVSRLLTGSPSADAIKRSIQLAVEAGLSTESLPEYMYEKLIPLLSTEDLKHQAVEQTMLLVKEYEKMHDKYIIDSRKERCAELILRLMITMDKTEEGISLFYPVLRRQKKSQAETTLYIVLRILEAYGKTQDWLQTYEKALADKMKPREYLCRRYAELKRIH